MFLNQKVNRVGATILMAAVFLAGTPISALAAVSVDIKANGSDGPVTINAGEEFTYSWSSVEATACVMNTPTGESGVEVTGSAGPIAPGHPWYPATGSSVTLTIDCTDGVNSFSDSVTVNVVVPNHAAYGHLDGAACDIIGGWSYDSDTPNDSTAVHLYDGPASEGHFITEIYANTQRDDVNSGLSISGVHGFTILTPDNLKDGTDHAIYGYAIDSDSSHSMNAMLIGAPITINCPGTPAAVTVDIKANSSNGPVTITNGEEWNYSWTSTGATACVITAPTGDSGISTSGNGGPITPAHPWYPTLTAPTTLTINCTNGTNSASDSVVIGVVAPPPPGTVTADIKINNSNGPVTITAGTEWNYSWTSNNATACVMTTPTGDSGVTVSGNGGPIVSSHPWYPTLTASTTLTLNCTDGVNSASDSVVIGLVIVPPPGVSADIKINGSDGPVTITQGAEWNYSWSSNNATACVITAPTGDSGVTLAGNGGPIPSSHPWYPTLTASTTLTINCTNGVNSATDSVVVGIAPAPAAVTADIKINGSDGPVLIDAGEPWNYSWSSTGASACVIISPTGESGVTIIGSAGPIVSSHPWYPTLTASTTLTINCTNGTDSATDLVVIGIRTRAPTECPLPIITLPALSANGTVGSSFSFTFSGNTPGTSTSTYFTFNSANLPPGLTLSSSDFGNPTPTGTTTVTISGTPTTAGSYNIPFTAVNDCGNATQTITITINNQGGTSCPVPTFAITSGLSASVTVNNAFSYTVTASSTVATTTRVTVASSSLPSWLAYDSTTKTFSGTPTSTGTVTVPVVISSDCASSTQNLVITINPVNPPPPPPPNNPPTPSSPGGGLRYGSQTQPVPVANFCPWLTSYLKMGVANDPIQVARLQAFLKVSEGLDYVTVNGVFDEATFTAVKEFQSKYSDDVLKPWGIAAPTGYVYKTTLGKINQILCGTGMPAVQKAVPHINKEGGSKEGARKEGTATSTIGGVPTVGSNVSKGQKEADTGPGFWTNVAGALFTWPSTPVEVTQCLYELILILVVLYILGSVLETMLYKDVPENVRKRFYTKWGTITGGLVLALIGAYFWNWCLLLPLLLALIATVIYIFIKRRDFQKPSTQAGSKVPLVLS